MLVYIFLFFFSECTYTMLCLFFFVIVDLFICYYFILLLSFIVCHYSLIHHHSFYHSLRLITFSTLGLLFCSLLSSLLLHSGTFSQCSRHFLFSLSSLHYILVHSLIRDITSWMCSHWLDFKNNSLKTSIYYFTCKFLWKHFFYQQKNAYIFLSTKECIEWKSTKGCFNPFIKISSNTNHDEK